jgi:hypothetical protein
VNIGFFTDNALAATEIAARIPSLAYKPHEHVGVAATMLACLC